MAIKYGSQVEITKLASRMADSFNDLAQQAQIIPNPEPQGGNGFWGKIVAQDSENPTRYGFIEQVRVISNDGKTIQFIDHPFPQVSYVNNNGTLNFYCTENNQNIKVPTGLPGPTGNIIPNVVWITPGEQYVMDNKIQCDYRFFYPCDEDRCFRVKEDIIPAQVLEGGSGTATPAYNNEKPYFAPYIKAYFVDDPYKNEVKIYPIRGTVPHSEGVFRARQNGINSDNVQGQYPTDEIKASTKGWAKYDSQHSSWINEQGKTIYSGNYYLTSSSAETLFRTTTTGEIKFSETKPTPLVWLADNAAQQNQVYVDSGYKVWLTNPNTSTIPSGSTIDISYSTHMYRWVPVGNPGSGGGFSATTGLLTGVALTGLTGVFNTLKLCSGLTGAIQDNGTTLAIGVVDPSWITLPVVTGCRLNPTCDKVIQDIIDIKVSWTGNWRQVTM